MVSRTSRKKSKGKVRKAKKEADREEAERALEARTIWWGWATGNAVHSYEEYIECKHGCGEIPRVDHPVASFMDNIFINWDKKTMTRNVSDSLQLYQQVWYDQSSRDLAVNIFISIGTNLMLTTSDQLGGFNGQVGALRVAKGITLLEKYHDGPSSFNFDAVYNSRRVQIKVRDLDEHETRSHRRDVLKFYSKRIPCYCLKKMHQEARRTIPKTGFCMTCKEEKERVALSVCSRCMVEQYCSRECQVADWPEHKKECDRIIRHQTANDRKKGDDRGKLERVTQHIV